MLNQLRFTLRHAFRLFFYGTIGVVFTLLLVFVQYLSGRADLDIWHQADLDEEFTVDSKISSFAEYQLLEDRLLNS